MIVSIISVLSNIGKNKELEEILFRLEANLSNNYKDNARDNLIELENKFNELQESGKLSEKNVTKYAAVLEDYKVKMKGYTHKDQTPYWT